jgi:hypothetical protein
MADTETQLLDNLLRSSYTEMKFDIIISSGSYLISQESLIFLRPKQACPSSAILSVIKILKLRSPVLKMSENRSSFKTGSYPCICIVRIIYIPYGVFSAR